MTKVLAPPCDCGGKQTCPFCVLRLTDERYARLWGRLPGQKTPPPVTVTLYQRRVSLPCVHEGPIVEPATCGCPSAELWHVRRCLWDGLPDDADDRVTRGEVRGSPLRRCDRCDGDVPAFRRHLLLHVLPVADAWGRTRWRWNLGQLRRRLPLFDGRIVVAIATTGDGSVRVEPPDVVRDYLGADGDRVEWVEVPNDRSLREVASFEPLFSRLVSEISPADVTLYAQAKGVTRPQGHPAHRWAEVLWESMCDYWPVVARALRTSPVAGSLKKHGRGFRESRSAWHFSGSWFWFRNRDLYGRDWRRIDRFWSGIETYASLHFRTEEAAPIFHQGQLPEMNLYRESYWPRLEREYAEWTAQHQLDRTVYE